MAGPLASYFDTSNDALVRSSDLIGVADSTLLTISFWMMRRAGSDTRDILLNDGSRVRLRLPDANRLELRVRESGTTVTTLQVNAPSPSFSRDVLYHYAMSCDLTDENKRWMWINGASVNANWDIYEGNNMAFSRSSHSIDDGAVKLGMDLAQIYVAYGQYVDDPTKLIAPDAVNSINYGPDGSWVTGTAPLMYFNRETGSTDPDDLGINLGSGGAFTIQGGGLGTPNAVIPEYAAAPATIVPRMGGINMGEGFLRA